ncbi:hypothetical protein KR054_009628 [Drosophila jambulina]|nr:hypothetical protein KR054_009628 [Drosophila jambulina]
MSSNTAIEVPIQPYAGPPLIIKDLVQPKPVEAGTRVSFFERSVITKKLLKQLALVEGGKGEKISMYGYDSVVDGLLDALEAFMKVVVQKVVELCEHRCGYKLYMNKRFVLKNDVRTTMTFLNDLELADYGSSDDEEGFYRNMAVLEDRKERKNRKERKEPKPQKEWKSPKDQQEEKATIRGLKASADSIAMLAFGSRKRPMAKAPSSVNVTTNVNPTPSGSHAPQGVPMLPRFKHVTIKDVLQFLEEDKRYCRSNMLYEAYLKYTT